MKITGIFLSILMAAALCGCGSGANSSIINGSWTAALTNSGSNGSPNFAFTVSFIDNGNGTINVTNLNFTTTPCFGSGATATGGFTLSGTLNGVTSGGFQMTVQSGASGSSNNNLLTLQGTVSNNNISGNWTLTGISGCTGSGTFTMNKM